MGSINDESNHWGMHGLIGFKEVDLRRYSGFIGYIKEWIELFDQAFASMEGEVQCTGIVNRKIPFQAIVRSVTLDQLSFLIQQSNTFIINVPDHTTLFRKMYKGQALFPRLSFEIDFGHDHLMYNPWMYIYFSPDIPFQDHLYFQEKCEFLFSKAFGQFSGLGGYLDGRMPKLPSSMAATFYENAWIEEICHTHADSTRLSMANNTFHAQFWLRACAWGMFTTTTHLCRLSDPLSKTLTTLNEMGASVQFLDEERLYLRLTQDSAQVPDHIYESVRAYLAPILPEAISTDCETARTYIHSMYDFALGRSIFLEGLVEDARQTHPPVLSWHDLSGAVLPPIVLGTVNSSDFSETDDIVFFFDGAISQEARDMFNAYIRSWKDEAFEGNSDIQLKFMSESQWSELHMLDTSFQEIITLVGKNSEKMPITLMGMLVEFRSEGEFSLRSFAAMIQSASESLGVRLLCCFFGTLEEGQSFTLLS